ncbi:hypothetical protein TUBRATIS_14410 [Tubulinosema ratisbonensis]|uniref:Uncharacterized protein n=1 Tax=Tubulinosema ratisbonensis TaxID=291195 RepID=A0A437ALJ4_9MICR|nr:hypothetical protein TUBRATIS_14410 [Tubulinosema ratisbonensis]
MLRRRWKKILYEDQPFPKNHFKPKKTTKKISNQTSLPQILLLIQNILSVLIYFTFFYKIKTYSFTKLNFLFLFTNSLVKRKKLKFKKILFSFTILGLIFVNIPIFKTLMCEIDDDTIYLHFIWLSFFYVIDKTKCTIMNEPEKPFVIKVPLKIEDVDFLKEGKKNVPMLGYNTIILGTFLLISRLNSCTEAFFLIKFTLFQFFCLEERYLKKKREFLFFIFSFFYVLYNLVYVHLFLAFSVIFVVFFILFVSYFVFYIFN